MMKMCSILIGVIVTQNVHLKSIHLLSINYTLMYIQVYVYMCIYIYIYNTSVFYSLSL